MSQYKPTVNVTNGSATVTIPGIDATAEIAAGDEFGVAGTGILSYEVAAAPSYTGGNTEVTLTAAYQGATASGVTGIFQRDFTDDGFPILNNGDLDAAAVVGRLAVKVQQRFDAIAAAVDDLQTGYLTKSVAGSANVALTASEQSNAVIEFTGELTGNINVTVGDDKDGYRWTLVNSTTGSFTLTFKATSGTGAVIDQGAEAVVYHDGTNIVELLTVTAAGKALMDDATADAQLDTLGGSTVGKAVFKAADEAAAQSALGLGAAAVADILGTVSQSGGTPTGAVIERGSNANGEYVRFADGTQICMTLATLAFVDAGGLDKFWQFPAVFSSVVSVNGTVTSSATPSVRDWFASLIVGVANIYTVAAQLISLGGAYQSGDTQQVYLVAIGRWF